MHLNAFPSREPCGKSSKMCERRDFVRVRVVLPLPLSWRLLGSPKVTPRRLLGFAAI